MQKYTKLKSEEIEVKGKYYKKTQDEARGERIYQMLTARFCLIAKSGWLFALEFSSSQLKREMQLVTRFINSLSYKQGHCSGDEYNIPDTKIPG